MASQTISSARSSRQSSLTPWQELRSVDIVLEEVAREFDGEDPLGPIMRGWLEKTREQLTDLHEVLTAGGALELLEPDEEVMALARKYFDNGLH